MVMHANDLNGTSDVALKFPGRGATKVIGGENKTGYFCEGEPPPPPPPLRERAIGPGDPPPLFPHPPPPPPFSPPQISRGPRSLLSASRPELTTTPVLSTGSTGSSRSLKCSTMWRSWLG